MLHLVSEKHSIGIDISESTILDIDPNTLKRRVKEAIEIKVRRPSLNRDTGTELSPVYNTILRNVPTSSITINKHVSENSPTSQETSSDSTNQQ